MSDAADVLAAAGRKAGIAVGPAELLRDGSHALFTVSDGVVARVGRAGSRARARSELEVSAWLAASGVPVVEAVSGVEQPTLVDDRPVTWWRELPPHRPATPVELGAVLQTIHRLPIPSMPHLPPLDPFADFAERIANASVLPAGDRSWLRDHLMDLHNRWQHLPPGKPICVVHGDAWQGNVAVPDQGEPVVLDLEHFAIGPPEWDLIAMAVDRTDFERVDQAEYRAFVDAYGGYDVTTWPGYRTLADILELRWVCFALAKASTNPRAADQARHRIACLRGGLPRPWRWTAL